MDEDDDSASQFPAGSVRAPRPAAVNDQRLDARDGLNNYHVYLARMALEPQGDTQFTFTVTHSMLPVGEFSVSVKGGGRGLDDMTLEAHNGLIDIFRQLLFRADRARQSIARHTARADVPDVPANEDERG